MSDTDILLVEDNHGDVALVERAFEKHDLPGRLHVARTGQEAFEYLSRDGDSEAPAPDLVLLDLNLPATSGHALLEEIKSDPRLQRLPVVVLTSSQSDEDLIDAYEGFANAYLTKPVDPDEFAERIRAFAEFWVSHATLPPLDTSGDTSGDDPD